MYVGVQKGVMPKSVLGFSIENSDGTITMLINSKEGATSGEIHKKSRWEICEASNGRNEEWKESKKDDICKHDY